MTKEDRIVLIGSFEPKNEIEERAMQERRSLAEVVRKAGLEYFVVDKMWARDYLVFHNNQIHMSRKRGNYADGGFLYAFPEFTLACSGVSTNQETGFQDDPETRLQILRGMYKNDIEILPPPDLNLNLELREHIDMVVFPIPQKGIAFVDKQYYHANKDEVDRFLARRKLDLRLVSNDYANPAWPCNTEIVETSRGLVAFVNKYANSGLHADLARLGIEVHDVPFSENCKLGGGVHCATNSIPRAYLAKALEAFS